jgi:hypothetical protein
MFLWPVVVDASQGTLSTVGELQLGQYDQFAIPYFVPTAPCGTLALLLTILCPIAFLTSFS